MSKGVYQRYRGSRGTNPLIPTLVVLCIVAAAVLIYVNANLEDGGDGTTLLAIPFSDEKIVFGEPQVELIVEDPVDVVIEVKASEYEKRVEKPVFLIVTDDGFEPALDSLDGYNTAVVSFKDDAGEILKDDVAKGIVGEISAVKRNPCAMISCFKDTAYASANTSLACMGENNKPWKDANGYHWLNPYEEASGEYILSVIEKAYACGFREILLTNAHFPDDESINFNEGLEKGAAISAFFDSVNALCKTKGDLNVAIWYEGVKSDVVAEEIDTITSKFYRIYTTDANIYNKVGTLIPKEKLEKRIVSIAG